MIAPHPRTRVAGVLSLTVLAALLLADPAVSQEQPAGNGAPILISQGTDLAELVRHAADANPSIKAARAAVDEAVARGRVETSYPDPSFTATWWPEKTEQRQPQIWEFMLEQGVPFPGKLSVVGRMRDAEVAAARTVLERTVRDVTLRVRESAAEISYLRRAREIAAHNRELLARLRAAGEAGYAADRTGLYDALRAQSQQSQTEFDARLLAEVEAAEIARLNGLLSRPSDAPVGAINLRAGLPLALPLAQIQSLAASGRQEARLARAMAEKSRAQRTLASLEYLPDFMLGVGYMKEDSLDDMEATDRWQFEVGVSLPLLFGKNVARRTEAEAGQARAEAMEREAADEARAEVAEAYFRLRNAERLIALYRDVLVPQALTAVNLADAWYRSEQGSFSDFVDAATLRYGFELALARAGADREKFLARLEALAERALTLPEGDRGGAPPAPDPDREWNAALARLEADRTSFDAALAGTAGAGESVLVPDPARLAALGDPAGEGAAAAEALFPAMSLDDVEVLAVTRSPAVLAAGRSLRAALEQYGQVAALDELLRGYASATGSLMTGVGGAMGNGVRTRFPFPGMLALKGEVVTQDALAAREELERARRDALAEARRLYWGLDATHRTLALLAEVQELLGQMVEAVRARYESGQGSLADLVRAQIELEKSRTELATLAEERRVLESGVRSVLALPRSAVIGLPHGSEQLPAPGDPAALVTLALARRQELRRMRAMAARMERMIQMAEREAVPGFSLDLSLSENQPLTQAGTMAMQEPFATSTAAAEGIGTPVRPLAGRVAGYVRETRERLAALRQEIRGAEEETVTRVRQAWFGYDRALREERLWADRVAELTRLASETQDRAYRAGRASLPEVLEAALAARASAIEAARRRADAGGAWAALEAAVGAPLAALND